MRSPLLQAVVGSVFFLGIGFVVPTAPASAASPITSHLSPLSSLPAQFRVWGSAGPAFPPPPAGWRLVRKRVPPLRTTVGERERGYALLAREPQGPGEGQTRLTELKTFAARGQYVPLTFAISARDDLSDVQVRAGALHGPGGAVIPANRIDVRVVRAVRVPVDRRAKTYRLEPYLLETRAAFAVGHGESAQVWLTLAIPKQAAAGTYRGTISISAAGRPASQVPVRVEVLPFSLPPAPIRMMMSFPRPSDSDARLEQEMVDMREHGMTSFQPSLSANPVSPNRVLGEDDLAAIRARAERMGAMTKRVFGGWRYPLTLEVGNQIAYHWDRANGWFVPWPHSREIDAQMLRAVDTVAAVAKAHRWPPPDLYLLDEPGGHLLLGEARYYYGLLKRRRPQFTSSTTIGGGIAMGFDEIGALSDSVDLLSTNRFDPEIAHALVARRKPYGVYNGSGDTPAGARFFFGYYGWKTGAQELEQWAYHFDDTLFSGDGFLQEDGGYVYETSDGPLPSLMWEGVRAGADDYRYVSLLWRLIAAGRASRQPAARAAAAHAHAVLTKLLGRIGWGFQAVDDRDRTPPPAAAQLQAWRWQVARQILALQPRVGAHDTSAAPPSPFAWPWAQPPARRETYGRELLTNTGFESGLGPWHVEAWSGKGRGRLDSREHHGSSPSVHIVSPDAQSISMVTVLAAKPTPALTLQADREYEFSAWVKRPGVTTQRPSLRIYPAKAFPVVHEGHQATPGSWTRIWVRVKPSATATVDNLVVWVQGPGDAWVDDVSLREVREARGASKQATAERR